MRRGEKCNIKGNLMSGSNEMSKMSIEEIEKLAISRSKKSASSDNDVEENVIPRDIPAEKPAKDDLYLTLHNLPSMSKFYPVHIKGQPMRTLDNIIVSNVDNENYIERYTELFSKRIIGIPPEQILSIDEDYLLIWLRENAFPGYTYRAETYQCQSCNTIVNAPEFRYNQFVFESNSDEINDENSIIELDSGKRIGIRARRRYHDIAVEKYITENYTNVGQHISKEMKKILKLAVNLNIEGCGDIEERSSYLLHDLSPMEFVEFMHKMKEKTLRCKIHASVNCPKCSANNKAAFFFRARLFLPSYQPKRPD